MAAFQYTEYFWFITGIRGGAKASYPATMPRMPGILRPNPWVAEGGGLEGVPDYEHEESGQNLFCPELFG